MRAEDAEHDHVALYRGTLVIAAVAIPAFALVQWNGPYDPLAPRLGFAAAALIALAGSYRSAWARRWLWLAPYVLCHGLFAWFAFIAYVHAMALEDIVGLVPIVIGAVVCARRPWQVAWFVAYMLTVLAVAYSSAPTSAVDVSVPVSLFMVIAIGLGWMSVGRDRLAGQLREANATLEARVAERTALLVREAAERRAAELRASAASEAKSRFLANMSHELRTPLNAVIGYTELVEAELTGTDHGALCADLERVRRAAGHLLAIIDNVLDLSRVEAGALQLEREPVVVCAAVDAAVELVRPSLTARRDRLVLAVAPELEALADRAALVRVLVHLLENAAKFTTNGTVTVTAVPVDAAVEIAVRDTGAGIPEHALARIFERFTQADDSSTRVFGGVGLGLAICRELVTRMDGSLTVRSKVGHGSVFTVRLPAA